MKARKKKIKMLVEKTDTGFSAFAEDFPIYTTGRTMPELLENAHEAASLCFEDEKAEPGLDDIRFEIDFRQFFQYYKVLNAKFLAARIGMNPTLLSQYIRGIKKPSAAQAGRILAGIQQIGRELSEISLIQR